MPELDSFLRPLLAADKRWAALERRVAVEESNEASTFARCFVDSGVGRLARTIPLVLSIAPRCLLESEFIDKFEPDQVIFMTSGAGAGRCRTA